MGTAHPSLTTRTRAQGPPISYLAFVPPRRQPSPTSGTTLVVVHGKGRASTRHFRAYLPAAIARSVALIAPTFPTDRFPRYQSLAGLEGPLAARTALLDTLDDARAHLGVPTDVIDLAGFSGGAQFAHRFTMLTPTRVRRAVLVSAGWYTYLDEKRPFPRGSRPGEPTAGLTIDTAAFLRTPVHVMVGERDTARDPNLRTGPSLDRHQGADRLTRALRWMDHLEDTARSSALPANVSFELLADTGHSFRQAVERAALVQRAFAFLHPAATPDHATPEGVS